MSDGIVEQFLSLKAETDADLLTMQCGDFYEFFADDAETVADELDLKISQKSSHGSSYPMAGVPVDDLTPYLSALVERGYRVAVADQYETGSGLAREIVRVVTPGTHLETSNDAAQYLAAVVRADAGSADASPEGATYGLAFADVTTGRFLATSVTGATAAGAELYRFDPAEVVPGPEARTDDALLGHLRERTDANVTLADAETFAPGRARHALTEQFGGASESVGLDSDATARAAGAALRYVEQTDTGVLASMTRLRTYAPDDHLDLDATTQRNLELVESMHGDSQGSLLATLDHTVTAPGGRLLREWLTRPRRDREELHRRQESVAILAQAALARDRVRDVLEGAYDLERLASRATSTNADAGDLLAVRDSIATIEALADAVADSRLADSPLSAILKEVDHEAVGALRSELDDALLEEPPDTVTQGELFQRGYDPDLDALIERNEAIKQWLEGLADREKRQHGLSHVSVDRNKTDGYYIQVGKSAADGVPEHYREIKTLKNSKRFVTDELADKEREILRIEESRGDLEYDLFTDLCEHVADHAGLLQTAGRALAEVDALASLAEHAAGNDWTRPELTEPGSLHVEAGRHPVVEQTTDFVPNDMHLDEQRRFLIVTGPNMSGKSTYMRQVALITLLAQIGSFVPARAAQVGLVDGIYTRVGALDELAQGRSTFMVEMQELSNILHSASDESLVILDEVGRGTATYDGISIAWAATEYLHNEVSAKTLFATHYHELTTLAEHLPRVENVHIAVSDEREESEETRAASDTDGDVTFLRTVEDGPTDRSYGVHVADLAGVPSPVVDRADEVLARLREEKAIQARGGQQGGESGQNKADTTTQAVFDLSAGEFAQSAGSSDDPESAGSTPAETSVATGGGTPDQTGRAASDGGGASSAITPETESVLEEIAEADINDTAPLEVMQQVQEWQQRLEERDE